MKFSLSSLALFLAAAAGSAAADLLDSDPSNIRAVPVHIQPVGATHAAPVLLAEIRYDVQDLSSAEVAAYAPPEGVDEADDDASASALYRIGLYDPKAGWLGATSVTAGATFAKGYRPHFVLTVGGKDAAGIAPYSFVGVAVRGLPIDAGATRDFGPQATVVEAGAGVVPALNRPVVLDPTGQKPAPEEEKTFLQKYWWAIGVALLMVVTSGAAPPEEK